MEKGEDNYKFRSLEVYCSTEWMHNDTKKYRTVFDRTELGIIYADLSFYNKLFDEQPWKAIINLKLTGFENGKEIQLANIEDIRTIGIDENIVHVNKGCGYDIPGTYWMKGQYRWDASIGDVIVGSRYFYINDVGQVEPKHNPYFSVISFMTYEGGKDDAQMKNPAYLVNFNREKTRYVWAEFTLLTNTEQECQMELFFHFKDSAGQLKGVDTKGLSFRQGTRNSMQTITGCCGSDIPGGWKDDRYSVEIVFMDTLIASLPFSMGSEEKQGFNLFTDHIAGMTSSNDTDAELDRLLKELNNENDTNNPNSTLEMYIAQLNELIGLEKIKQQIQDQINYLEFLKIRKEKGFKDEEKISLDAVLTGNPGTGKTTVVKLLGKIYHKMGLLQKEDVTEVGRNDLVAEYVGQTAPKVMKVIEKARGGILFIDEAYSLARTKDDSNDFGKEVIEILIKEMSDGKGDTVVMVAGYPAEMKTFISSNPGLKSRFHHYFRFPDYTPDELLGIFDLAISKRNLTIEPQAREIVRKELIEAYRTRDSQFGNARYVWGIVDEAKMNMGIRLVKQPDYRNFPEEELSRIISTDVEKIFISGKKERLKLAINEELLTETLSEFDILTGLNEIKNDVHELVKLTRYYSETGKNILNKLSLHTVFTGNPGTGKTTVARLMGKLFKALGLLEKGHLVECDRESLIAGYVGQTAIKTQGKIEEALDGVLFIDEAYALAEGTESFGNEAIEIILKRMEDLRGRIAVIVAGYPDNMEQFLLSNPGLKSRFDRYFVFPDYSEEELFGIAYKMLSAEGYKLDDAASVYFRNYLKWLCQAKDKYFGNARTMRNITQGAIRKQNLRMAELPADQRTDDLMSVIQMVDLRDLQFDPDEKLFDPVP